LYGYVNVGCDDAVDGEVSAAAETTERAMMTNTAAVSLMTDSSLVMSADQRPTWTSQQSPPTPPPPPVKARAHGMVRPAIRRRAPAVPPPSWDDTLDPVAQNEQNDVIWQRRVDCARVDSSALDRRHALRHRRRASPHPLPAPAPHGECRQCRRVEDTRLRDRLCDDR